MEMPDETAKTDVKPAEVTEAYTPEVPATDVKLAEDSTGAAPSFRAPVAAASPPPGYVPRPPLRRGDQRPQALPPGATIDDFEIVRLLGRGAFGHVYLARQVSLDREVALKISANRGSEGRTMARLEQPHIVQVYSEKVDEATDQRLLCMQLVPGVVLDKIIGSIAMQLDVQRALSPSTVDDSSTTAIHWRGSDVLAIIDINSSMPAALDPAALRDREALNEMDDVESTAWMGARLGEALDFAHQRGVLHRDIKPANILVSPYGRPMLADFNISAQQVDEANEMFGGTVAYMAPEHLDAFNPADDTTEAAVTAQADIYSLGIVLDELLNGRRPQLTVDPNVGLVDRLRKLSEYRRQKPPHAKEVIPSARKTLEQTICRCMAPYPADRFDSGAALAEQLEGCRQMRHAERALPPIGRVALWNLVPWILNRPFFWFVMLVLIPQIIASAFNISYNFSQIVDQLSEPQKKLFRQIVTIYNVLAYPVAIALFCWAFFPVRRTWRRMHAAKPLPADEVVEARRRALRLPLWVTGLTAAGWLPGGVLFPAIISARTEMLSFAVWLHFIASFTLSGLIALAYSLCGSQFVIQRALYPRMWDDVRHFTAVAREELAPMSKRLAGMQLLAGSALVAAILVLTFNDMTPLFKSVVAGLIILGWAGYQLATEVTQSLTRIVLALTSGKS